MVKEVLIKNKNNICKPNEYYEVFDYFGSNILTKNGREWESIRKMMNPLFTLNKHLEMVVETSIRHTNTFLNNYKGYIEPVQLMKRLSLDVIGSILFGYEVNALSEQSKYVKDSVFKNVPKDVKFTMKYIFENMLISSVVYYMFGNIVDYLPFYPFNEHQQILKDFSRYMDYIIENPKTNQYDFLTLTASSELSRQEIKANMFLIFFAGFDTTSRGLTWALILLAIHKDIQEKLFENVDHVLKGREPTFEDVHDLKYSTCCFKEALRLYGPVEQVLKRFTKDVHIGPNVLKKDSYLLINIHSLHHNENIWDDAKMFIPERHLKEIEPFKFIPFSEGSRDCLGKFISIIEATIVLSKIIQKYSIHLEDGISKEEYLQRKSLVFCEPKNEELKILLKERKK